MTWQHVAGLSGGTVAALCEFGGSLFAATSAGVFRSLDRGVTWCAPPPGHGVAFAEALAASEDTVYVGTIDGLHRSRDGGRTWQHVLSGSRVLSVATASVGLVLAGTEDDGLLRSEDHGTTWSGANAGLLDLTISSIALAPNFEVDHTAFVGTPSGLYRTRNGGRAWRAVDVGVDDVAIQCIACSPEDATVLAGTDEHGLFISRDGGGSFAAVAELRERAVTAVAFNRGIAVAATDAGLFTSNDDGTTWRASTGAENVALCLLLADDARLAGMHRGGILRSTDGANWHPANDGLSAWLVTSLVVTDESALIIGGPDGLFLGHAAPRVVTTEPVAALARTADGTVYAALEDGLRASHDGGRTWRALSAKPVHALTASADTIVRVADAEIALSFDGTTWRPAPALPEGAGEVVTLALAPRAAVFVATRTGDDVVLWRWTPDSSVWQRWFERRAAGVVSIAISPTYSVDSLVFVTIGTRIFQPMHSAEEVRRGQRRPLWRSVELPHTVTTLALREHHVWAATSAGVYRSHDRALDFEGEPHGPHSVVALTHHRDRLYALALGGTVSAANV